jgi:hypothetical protein
VTDEDSGMQDAWEELDALCAEAHALDSAWSERHARLVAEMESLRPILDLLNQHHQQLAPEQALEQVRERLLDGAGIIQQTSASFGLDRLVVLAWPAAADPRPELSGKAGEYRVEVWLGINEQGRPRVRVVGAKRLEAVLPAPIARFRDVLLSAVRAPAFTPVVSDEPAPDSGDQPPDDQAAAGAQDSDAQPPTVEEGGQPPAAQPPT